MNNKSVTKILFLAANPKNTGTLELTKEIEEVRNGLRSSAQWECFALGQRFNVRPEGLQQAFYDERPQIVHFSGHGLGTERSEQSAQGMRDISVLPESELAPEGLVFEDGLGQVKLVSTKTISDLFECFADEVECVVLNACYSVTQAEAIAQYIPYVIGMNRAVGDTAARVFAVGFYEALGNGRDIEAAFKLACNRIALEGIPESLTPKLIIQKKGVIVPDNNDEALKIDHHVAVPVMLELPAGSVRVNSPFYVDRPPIEKDCYETILQPGALIVIKAPRQMGKSSLLQRILVHGQSSGQKTVRLDFQSIDAEFLTDTNLFLQWFCASISSELGLDDRLEELWKGVLGSKNKCTNYFQRYLLTTITEPLGLGLDEVDQVFQHPNIAQEFFSLLRAWHEKGKNEPIWQKLRLVIVHSKEVYIPLNINQSPFNVGLPIELPELTETQVVDLVERHGLNWSKAEVKQLMDVVDGHPYLLRKALYEIARGSLSLERFVEVAPTEEGLYGDHLRRHLLNLKADPEMAMAMRQVIASSQPIRLDETQSFKLRSIGLVELQGNEVQPLCNLYRTYFRDQLGV
jgi:AAA-like domain/CHAT domain